MIIVIDFGSQFNQLIARRVRENSVYCQIEPASISIDKLKDLNPKGIILSGGPSSIYEEDSPIRDEQISASYYKLLIDSFPASIYWDESQDRYRFLKRRYIDIR